MTVRISTIVDLKTAMLNTFVYMTVRISTIVDK